RLVELRAQVRREGEEAGLRGDHELASKLDAIQLGTKIAANATAYGIPIELNVIEHRRPVWVTVHLPDGSSYKTRSRRTEETGQWFHPLLATLVAGGGRLLLATAMALVREQGGRYAFCDTDSLFATGLSLEQLSKIVARFESLNPFDRELVPGSILEIEREN